MKVLEGDKLKSKLTGMMYEVKKTKDKSVVLESRDGLNQEWTDMGNLWIFFEDIDGRSVKP